MISVCSVIYRLIWTIDEKSDAHKSISILKKEPRKRNVK